MKKNEVGDGAKGFNRLYWEENYYQPKEIDGVGNALEHARYLKSFFALDDIEINTAIDFGFGIGELFKKVIQSFSPKRAVGIEPSAYIFKKFNGRELGFKTKIKLLNIDLLTWCQMNGNRDGVFDLGICNSVFQYLSNRELEEILPVMEKKVKYLYFTVPTDKELDRQIKELNFYDRYAIRRSKTFYKNLLRPHFTIVSNRILESKYFYNEKNSLITDLLFRF